MVCFHYSTPRPRQIKNGLCKIVWRRSYCSQTDNNTDFHWVLCACSRYLSRSHSPAVRIHHNALEKRNFHQHEECVKRTTSVSVLECPVNRLTIFLVSISMMWTVKSSSTTVSIPLQKETNVVYAAAEQKLQILDKFRKKKWNKKMNTSTNGRHVMPLPVSVQPYHRHLRLQ